MPTVIDFETKVSVSLSQLRTDKSIEMHSRTGMNQELGISIHTYTRARVRIHTHTHTHTLPYIK